MGRWATLAHRCRRRPDARQRRPRRRHHHRQRSRPYCSSAVVSARATLETCAVGVAHAEPPDRQSHRCHEVDWNYPQAAAAPPLPLLQVALEPTTAIDSFRSRRSVVTRKNADHRALLYVAGTCQPPHQRGHQPILMPRWRHLRAPAAARMILFRNHHDLQGPSQSRRRDQTNPSRWRDVCLWRS
jgi:hypothetical protein